MKSIYPYKSEIYFFVRILGRVIITHIKRKYAFFLA